MRRYMVDITIELAQHFDAFRDGESIYQSVLLSEYGRYYFVRRWRSYLAPLPPGDMVAR
jgi:hypothetical protein